MADKCGCTKRSPTLDQHLDPFKDLDDSLSEFSTPVQLPLSHKFVKYWDVNDAAAAMSYLKYMEMKTSLRSLQKIHGSWHPPPDVANYLKKRPKPMTFTKVPNTKNERAMNFVLHTMGVSAHDNQPYKNFLKAKTIRQKRFWLYKHIGPLQTPIEEHWEPLCHTRLKRLYFFFPDQFKEEDDGMVYFDNKMIFYNATTKLFYFRTRPYVDPGDSESSTVSSEELMPWRSD